MPFTHTDKNKGDLIKSEDWNSAMKEIVRVGGVVGEKGAIKIGDATADSPGTIRYKDDKFQGFAKDKWIDFGGGESVWKKKVIMLPTVGGDKVDGTLLKLTDDYSEEYIARERSFIAIETKINAMNPGIMESLTIQLPTSTNKSGATISFDKKGDSNHTLTLKNALGNYIKIGPGTIEIKSPKITINGDDITDLLKKIKAKLSP